jgi:hypothetical protein
VAGPQTAEAIWETVDARAAWVLPIWLEDARAGAAQVGVLPGQRGRLALQDGVADAAGIDTAMQLGSITRGPLAWAASLGYRRVVAVLDHLWDEYHE